jgi:hypothetical protein
MTTGCNTLGEGTDIVVEGDAIRVRDDARLHRIADAYERKYGDDWRFSVRDERFVGPEGNVGIVYEVAPGTAFAFGKGETYSQTRWRF